MTSILMKTNLGFIFSSSGRSAPDIGSGRKLPNDLSGQGLQRGMFEKKQTITSNAAIQAYQSVIYAIRQRTGKLSPATAVLRLGAVLPEPGEKTTEAIAQYERVLRAGGSPTREPALEK